VRENLDQVGNVAAGVVDVRLEQNAVTRSLVQLNVELAREQSFERRAIETGRTTQQRDASRIQNELVTRPRVVDRFPSYSFRVEVLESAGPIFCGHHLSIGRDAEVFRDQRMLVHLATKDQRQFD